MRLMDRLIGLVLIASFVIWHSGHRDKAIPLLGIAVILVLLRLLTERK